MSFRTRGRTIGLGSALGLTLLLALFGAGPAAAQEGVDSGDTAWMLTASAWCC